ncbi:MAG: DUF6599 family protein [Bacteroidota bacterium]
MKTLFIFLMVLCFERGISQAIVPLSGEDFQETIVGKPDNYDLTSLLSYNDDADLFLEMGFQSLIVQEIAWEQIKLKVEVYRLGSPEAAFGVFFLSKSKCIYRDTIAAFDCDGLYQYMAAYGSLFISVSSETGSAGARERYLRVAGKVMQKNPQSTFQLPEPFNQPQFQKWRNNLIYIQGPVGLQNCLIPWQNIFLGVRFNMYATTFTKPDNDIWFARIHFETPDDQMLFLELAGLTMNGTPVPNTNANDGIYREYKSVDDLTIYFLQSQEPWPISDLLK